MEKEPFPCPEGGKMDFCLKIYMRSSEIHPRKSVFHPLFSSHVYIGVVRLYPSNRGPELGYRGLVARPDGWTCGFLSIWAGFSFMMRSRSVRSCVFGSATGASYLTPCVSKHGNQPIRINTSINQNVDAGIERLGNRSYLSIFNALTAASSATASAAL